MSEPEELRHLSERKALFDKVYRLTCQIPYGKVSTYGALGLAVEPEASPRVIGYVMSICTDDAVPCHRVIKSDGSIGGYGADGIKRKVALLEEEGIHVKEGKIDLAKYLFQDFKLGSKKKSGEKKGEGLLNFL